VSLVV